MNFSFSKVKKDFENNWKKIYKEYESLGMSKEDIEKIYQYDLKLLNLDRKNRTHEQMLYGSIAALGECKDNSALPIVELETKLSYEDSYSIEKDRFRWLDSIENIELYNGLIQLSDKDKELLTKLIIDGYSKSELARLHNVSPGTISQKIKRTKKKLKA